MPEAQIPLDEIARLSALHSLKLLDTPPEERFDRLSRLASQFLNLPVAYVALMDGERQWYKSVCGLSMSETSRKHSLCSHTILCSDPIICPDTLEEPRFADNPYVVGDPQVRLYMGHTLKSTSGHKIGTFCAMGFESRSITEEEIKAFTALAQIAESEINHIDLVRLQEDLLEKKRELQKYTSFVRDVFGRYVSDQVAESLLSQPTGLELGGAHQELSILFSDLRGFSALSERLPAQQMIELVNEYLGAMVPVIERHGGTIDEFIGDAILVLFGAPLAQEDHALRSVACALEMQQELTRLNVRLQTDNRTQIQMGIGVHTGKAVVGNIGCQSRMKYGAVGSAVNLASRIQGFTLGGQTLVSSSTYDAIKPYARVDGQLRVAVKGYEGPVSVFDIGALHGGGVDVELPVPEHTSPVHR
jgi:adenylate cyclase